MSAGVLRPHGTIIIADPDLPHEVQRDTLQCCHCQRMWVVQPGSGRRRGFCMRCNGVTCGAAACDECLPIEKRIAAYERGQLVSLENVGRSEIAALPVSVRPLGVPPLGPRTVAGTTTEPPAEPSKGQP